MYQEIRGLIFKAVMEHEVGHTIGLRHNFARLVGQRSTTSTSTGTLKRGGLPDRSTTSGDRDHPPSSVSPESPSPTSTAYRYARRPNQISARMREFQYSSIMDYSSAFNTDFGGIGRYDEAAIMFAYTTGADRFQGNPDSPAYNRQEWGYVEAWDNMPNDGASIFRDYENARGIGYYHPLERYHYTTLATAMGGGDPQAGIDLMRDRVLIKYDDMLDMVFDEDPSRPVEVPYLFCSDEFNNSRQFCRTWDRGADAMEQTLDYIDRYRGYYYWDTHRRDRLGWFTSDTLNRYASRLFLPLIDTYQRWLLGVGATGGGPDQIMDLQWQFAAFAGLNLLGEVLTTPSHGSYRLDELPIYDNETGEEIGTREEYTLYSYGEDGGADLYLTEGVEGRDGNSQYDADLGYYYYQYPTSSGHFWTYLAGILSITSSTVSVRGVEDLTGFGDQSYVIPPYLVFQEEITNLFNGLLLEDYDMFAPVVVDGEVISRPLITQGLNDGSYINPETGATIPEGAFLTGDMNPDLAGPPINTRVGFSEQLYAMLFGMSSFTSNYSLRFPDQLNIFRVSSGEENAPGPGYEQIRFCDPFSAGGGHCYATIDEVGTTTPTAAHRMIDEANALRAQWETANAGLGGDAQSLQYDIEALIERMNIIRSMYEFYGRNF